jgi:acylphosphatase
MGLVTVRVVIRGRVQGVSFRASMREEAARHRVDGWVRNTDDGSVEAVLQGDEDGVYRLVRWAEVGPPGAKVSSVVQERLDSYPRQTEFRIAL